MHKTTVIGPFSGNPYPALDTGETWNGARVLAFRLPDLLTLIRSGDGRDANGEGLSVRAGHPVDLTEGYAETVPAFIAEVDGDSLIVYAPEGRSWEEA